MKIHHPIGEVIKLPKAQASEIARLCEAYYRAPMHQGGGDTPKKIAARQAYGEKSRSLARKIFGLELSTQEAFHCVQYHQTDWTMTNPGTLAERIAVLTSAVKEGEPYLGEGGMEISRRDYFKRVFFMHDYATQGKRPVGTAECGGIVLKDTARALYRLLFMTSPKQVDFSDMYKTGEWFALTSPDYQFVAHVELWKYELAVRLSATKEHITGQRSAIQCGIPDSNNGITGKSPLFKAWSDCLALCLKSKLEVYSGTNFTV